MLHLQANSANDAKLSAHLAEASNRISAIARAYERLAYDAEVDSIDLSAYLREVCVDAVSGTPHCKLDVEATPGILLHPDRAIPIALIVNEIVSNAAKHAFSGRSDNRIGVRVVRQNVGTILISVRDNGVGLPPEFDLTKSKGLGMRVVVALAKQLGGDVTQVAVADGAEFALLVPVEHQSDN
jgi:two-component sensor histidine kinase